MTAETHMIIHATTVAIKGHAILIQGPSGSGKSDLALRLIDRGAMLVSDDYTKIDATSGTLIAAAPDTIAGMIEVRGLGIITLPHLPSAPVALLIDLGHDVPRLPEPENKSVISGISIATLALAAHEASAPIKVEWALDQILGLS
jgi:HPr kinase/phosphorylase